MDLDHDGCTPPAPLVASCLADGHALIGLSPIDINIAKQVNILASEMEVGITATSGPVLERAGDLAAILTNLESRDVEYLD